LVYTTEKFKVIYFTLNGAIDKNIMSLMVKGVRDILVQILPKAPNLAQMSLMLRTVWIFDPRGCHIGKIQNGHHPGEMSIAVQKLKGLES